MSSHAKIDGDSQHDLSHCLLRFHTPAQLWTHNLRYPPFRKVPQGSSRVLRVHGCRHRFGCAPPTTRLALASARDLRASASTDGGAARHAHLHLRPTCATTSTTCVGTRRVNRLLTFPSPAPRYMYATPPTDSHSTMFRAAVTTFKRTATPGSQPVRQIGSGIIGESFASHHITSHQHSTAQHSTAQHSTAQRSTVQPPSTDRRSRWWRTQSAGLAVAAHAAVPDISACLATPR